jgi:ABC-type multidrug transport system fused ATPase/permease subunit
MHLQEMKKIWEQYDAKIERTLKINRELLKEHKLSKARWALRRFAIFPILDLIFALAVIWLVGAFVGDQWPDPRFVLPGSTLLLAAIIFLIVNIYQLNLISMIDFGSSVAGNQRKLELLKVSRIRTIKWVLLLAPLTGFAVLVVGLKGLLDLDIVEHLSSAWLAANVAFGLAFVPFGIWTARWLAGRFGQSTLLRILCDDVSGRSLQTAKRFLNELAEFE